jgi:hypothetical protein
LGEFEPTKNPDKGGTDKGGDWTSYLNRRFIHREILNCPTENKDFIFSIDPNLIYLTTQLWSAFDNTDIEQFLKYFCYITKAETTILHKRYDKEGKIHAAYKKWVRLLKKEGIPIEEVVSSSNCDVEVNNIKDEYRRGG